MEEGKDRLERDATAPALRLAGLCRRFTGFPGIFGLGSRRALSNVDLSLARGSSLGLVGPNGSGKSTLLRLAAGVDRPSSGRVELFGVDLARRGSRSVRSRVAYLPDDSPFPAELSARSALDLIGSLAGIPRRERRARSGRLLEQVGLSAAAGRALRTYSRGMLRRFGLAQAFLDAPDLVLLDEPTAGLDAPGYRVLDELTSEARARGASLVVASHVLSDLHATSDHLAVLIDGELVAHGTPGEVLARDHSAGPPAGAPDMRVSGLDAAGRAALETWVREHGASLSSADAGQLTLAELFGRLAPPESRP